MSDRDASRMSVVIVDDEALARRILREFLSAHADVDVIAECANGFEAVKAVSEKKPDLILLDVQMPKLDGFEVLELIGGAIPVVFITAYDQYAIKAFEIHAVDYLLKPFSADRLGEALDRARQRVRRGEPMPVREVTAAARERSGPLHRILIRDRADVHVVPIAKVDYIESQDDYVAIHSGGKSFLKEQTLAELEAALDARSFVRVHRRYILNVARLAKIEVTDTDSRVAILTDGARLPVSRTGYARLRELL